MFTDNLVVDQRYVVKRGGVAGIRNREHRVVPANTVLVHTGKGIVYSNAFHVEGNPNDIVEITPVNVSLSLSPAIELH